MTQPRPLTACQVEVLRLAAAHIAEHSVSPTRSELARAYGCRDTSVTKHLARLREHGLTILPAGREAIRVAPSRHARAATPFASVAVCPRCAADIEPCCQCGSERCACVGCSACAESEAAQ